jgi:aminoglycoside phosphotransferase (APT) family kinase protein
LRLPLPQTPTRQSGKVELFSVGSHDLPPARIGVSCYTILQEKALNLEIDSSASWAADIDVSDGLAATLVAKQFPHLARLPVRRLAEGWDNVVFTIGSQWILRLPRRTRAIDGVRREIRYLPRISQNVSISVPLPILLGAPTPDYPWPFFGYRRLPGKESCDRRLDDARRSQLARPIAHFLRTLHASQDPIKHDGLPSDSRRIESPERLSWGRARLLELRDVGEDLPYPELQRCLSLPPKPKTALMAPVHGDLHFRHLLLDHSCNLSGVIDWGKLHIGNPAIDLQLYWSFFPPNLRHAFLDEYGSVDEYQLVLARSVAVWLNAVILHYARDQRLDRVVRAARTALLTVAATP